MKIRAFIFTMFLFTATSSWGSDCRVPAEREATIQQNITRAAQSLVIEGTLGGWNLADTIINTMVNTNYTVSLTVRCSCEDRSKYQFQLVFKERGRLVKVQVFNFGLGENDEVRPQVITEVF